MMSFFFFFNDTATTEIYTLSLHDALPIFPVAVRPRVEIGVSRVLVPAVVEMPAEPAQDHRGQDCRAEDRKSTRLNSSHSQISYAVFCLKKKKQTELDVIIDVILIVHCYVN